ncbi:uncharacterized protein [Physcomitrium patens]|uniref:BHLH domain-containing protein n=1 Tax=Physcomitrium patens TaxID=3218 RepID=A0A7I4EIQ3_PHYPA|nr:uncharacterized protein LOC112286581 [Physcomitrium patens]|eukprot:XP_024384336.1 uncharacterized protein LOC112286581 [Physcomitrella patens]
MRGLSTIDMEKGYHGSEVHSDAKASSFPLDLGAMLDGTESPLQKQVYEYFQDPLSFPESIGQAQGEDGFSNAFPPYLTCSSPLEAGQSSFQSMHVEIIQAAATNVLRRREPNGFLHDNGRDETQITQYTSNTETRTSTVTQFTTNGSSAQGQMQLRSTNRNCLPHQRLYSADHKPGNDIESKFFHAPAPPKLVHSSKPANSHVSGENSDYETSCSPNAQKTTGRELLSPQLRTVRSHKSQRIGCEQRMKSKRLTDQAEHILRERQRRDDMSNKFLMLESLLPPGPKRDRSTIVDHSVAYVKSLHECIKNLQEKRLEILKSNACSLSGVQIKGTPKQKKQKQNNSVAYNYVSSPDLRKEVLNVAFLKSCAAREESESDTLGEERCIEKIEVHMDWPHQIVIEITCRPHPHIQSQIMKEMERLEMDVSSCSITKFHNHLVCVIILKPRVVKEPSITGDDVIEGLKSAIISKDS